MAGKGSFREGEGAAKGFAKGVDTLAKSLDELSSKGKLGADSISAMSKEVGKVNPLLGALGAAIGLVVAQGEKLKALELADAMQQFAVATDQVSIGWDKFTAGISAGAGHTGEMREKLVKLAETQVNLQLINARVNAQIEKQNKLMEEGKVTEQQATAAIEQYVATERNRFAFQTQVRAGLEREIDALKRRNREVEKAPKEQSRWDQAMHISEIRQEVRNDLLEDELRLKQDIADADARLADSQWNEMLASQEQRQNVQNAQLEKQNELWGEFGQGVALTAATEALNAYYDALDKTVSLNAIFAGGFDRAMRNAAAATVRSVGQQAAVRAIFELAEGWACLGNPLLAEFAPFHFKSAAIFGGIAIGAGPGAGLLSVMPAGGGGGKEKGGAGSGSGSSGGGGPNINVTFIGTLDTQARRDIWAQIRQEIIESDL